MRKNYRHSSGVGPAFFKAGLATNQCIAAAEVMLIDGHKGTKRIATIACRPDLQTIRNPDGARHKFLAQCIARKRVGVLIAACPDL